LQRAQFLLGRTDSSFSGMSVSESFAMNPFWASLPFLIAAGWSLKKGARRTPVDHWGETEARWPLFDERPRRWAGMHHPLGFPGLPTADGLGGIGILKTSG
jgi:hypothetical protein